MTKSRAENLVLAFKDTVQAYTGGRPTDSKFDYGIMSKLEVEKFNFDSAFEVPQEVSDEIPPINVLKRDIIQVASNLSKQAKVGILDMANDQVAGGGVEVGDGAEEEELARRSNLYAALSKIKYPWPNQAVVLVKHVLFFKDQDYKYMSSPFVANVICVSALRLNERRSLSDRERDFTIQKIRLAFLALYKSGVQVPVMSALGSGCFKNKPEEIADLFYQVLVEEKMATLFDRVVFAVLNDGNGPKNYEIFNNKFSDYAQIVL